MRRRAYGFVGCRPGTKCDPDRSGYCVLDTDDGDLPGATSTSRPIPRTTSTTSTTTSSSRTSRPVTTPEDTEVPEPQATETETIETTEPTPTPTPTPDDDDDDDKDETRKCEAGSNRKMKRDPNSPSGWTELGLWKRQTGGTDDDDVGEFCTVNGKEVPVMVFTYVRGYTDELIENMCKGTYPYKENKRNERKRMITEWKIVTGII